MAPQRPLWPNLPGLAQLWDSDLGIGHERAKARAFERVAPSQVPARPKALLIGAASTQVLDAVQALRPSSFIIAYPPALGGRLGDHPALVMDTDLPPFSRAHFDLVVLSYALEYRRTPLALLSLTYEILLPQGRLAVFTPHPWGTEAVMAGDGRRYWGWQVRTWLRQSAFHVRGQQTIRLQRGRPTSNFHLAQPQVPPRPGNRLSITTPLMEFWRSRQRGGIAAAKFSRQGRGHEPD